MEEKTKPVAAGFELQDGQWILDADGVLSFAGKGGVLGSGMYHIYKSKIKKVIVAGFEEIAAGLFVGYSHLEAAEFGESVRKIGMHSFADCSGLRTVTFAGETPEMGSGAFDGSPWKAALQGKELQTKSVLASPEAREILERTRAYLKQFLLPAEQRKISDADLEGCMQHGARSEDPALMYLWAERLFWGDLPGWIGQKSSCSMWFSYDLEYSEIEDDPFYWYEKAAEAGFVPAICWLYWCCRRGIRKDESGEQAAYWLEKARAADPVSAFEFDELNMICEIADELEDAAHWADIEEDVHCDEPDYVVNPGYRELHASALAAYDLGCMLGATVCVPQENLIYDEDPRLVPCYMLVEKRCWQIWCALNGVGLKDVSAGQMQRWLDEAVACLEEMKEEAWMEYEKQIVQQMEALIDELLPAVLRIA